MFDKTSTFLHFILSFCFSFLVKKQDISKSVLIDDLLLNLNFEDKRFYKCLLIDDVKVLNLLIEFLYIDNKIMIHKLFYLLFKELKYPAYCYFVINITLKSVIDVSKHKTIDSDQLLFTETFDKFFSGQWFLNNNSLSYKLNYYIN